MFSRGGSTDEEANSATTATAGDRGRRRYLRSRALVGLGLSGLRQSISGADAALVLVTVIVAVATSGQRVSGVLAAASSSVWFDFFFTQPYDHLSIVHRGDIETTVLLLAVGVALTELAARGQRRLP